MPHTVRERWLRYSAAERAFRYLFPDITTRQLQKLVALAVAYWDRPGRFA